MDKYEVLVEALNKTNMSVEADFNLKTEKKPSNNITLMGEGGESEERVSLKMKSKFAKNQKFKYVKGKGKFVSPWTFGSHLNKENNSLSKNIL